MVPRLRVPREELDPRTPEEILQYWEEQSSRVTPPEQVLDYQRRVMEGLDSPGVRAYIHNFMRSVTDVAYDQGGVEEVNKAMSSLFWPASNERMLAGLLRKELFTARAYQVTAKMVDAVTGTYINSASSIGHLKEEEPPSEAGFVWLDKPFLSTDSRGLVVANRAVSWSPVTIYYPRFKWLANTRGYSPQTHPDYYESAPGIRLNAWFRPGDQDSYWSLDNQQAYELLGQPLVLGHTSTIPFGTRFGGHPKANFDMTPDDFAHWTHVLWAFMQTEIVVNREAPIQRSFRRRAERTLKFASVNVITLRRMVSYGNEGEGEQRETQTIDWSCQWVVQGHHRHLESYSGTAGKHHATPDSLDRGVCAVCQGRITWVRPYLKGPDGLPLRSAEQLYRLAR